MTHFKGVRDKIRVKVTAELPADEGKVEKVPFVCVYRVPNVEQSRALIRDAETETINDDEIVREWIEGWDKLLDADNEPIEFSADALSEAMNIGPYRKAIVGGFMQVIFGREALRRKN